MGKKNVLFNVEILYKPNITVLKKLLLFLTVITFCLSQVSLANGSESAIEGTVINSEGTPIAAATVALFYPGEDEPAAGVVTDEEGNFTLRNEPGSYTLRITFISYENHEQEITLAEGETKNVGEVTLYETTADLDEVVVEAQPRAMEMRFDRRVYRADEDIDAFGGTALDLLDNIPSVESDFDGNLSLRGSENVRVLINGRSSALLSGGTDALAAIPQESIERVEVITNPSARYQAEGDAGVINIVLKRNRVAGFNGSALGRLGFPNDTRSSVNLNFMSNNVNWFTNLGFRLRERPAQGSRFQSFQSADTSYTYDQNQDRVRDEIRGDGRIGAEIFIGETQTLTPSLFFRYRDRDNTTETRYRDMDLEGNMLREVFREDDEYSNRTNIEFELAYDKEFDQENRRLQIDAKFDYQPEEETNNLLEENVLNDDILGQQRTDNSEEITDLQFNADYVHPIGESVELEAGARSSFRWVDNWYDLEEFAGGVWTTIDEFSSDFNYYQNVNAIYAIASTQIGDFSIQGGLRGEQTIIETEVELGGESSRRNYIDLFPSVYLGYEFNENNSVQASYSRRLSRPRFRNILPFSNFRDSRNIFTGNPSLDPVYSNSYELSYMRYWESGSANTTVYHRYRTGVVERITEVQQDGVTRRFPINLSTQTNWGAEFALSQNLWENFRVRTSLNYFTADTDGFFEGQQFQRETTALFGRFRTQWSVTDNLRVQSTLWYRGPRNTTQGRRAASYSVNGGISYELFNGDATLSLSGRDLFNTRGRDIIIDEPGFFSRDQYQWRTRSLRLNFVYRFSSM